MSRGIAEHGYEPILALHQQGRENCLLTQQDQERAFFFRFPRAKRGRSVVYYLQYVMQNIRSIHGLVSLIREQQVAIVHINEILDVYAGIAAWIAGVPSVWHVRADLAMVPRVRWVLRRIVPRLAHKVIVVSQSVQERMFPAEGGDGIVMIHNPGPDAVRFHLDVDGSPIRREFGLDDRAPLVTLVAKLSERKGHRTLIRAAPQVLSSFPNTRFAIVGGTLEGDQHKEYAKELKAIARELGMEDSVIFTGFRSDVPEIMGASDILTHCTIYPDPFPGVVLQAMAVGKPVIASSLGGPREQIEHGISGLLVDPGKPSELADGICSLLANREKRESLGSAAWQRVRSRFSSESYFRSLADLYDTLVR